MTKTMTKTSRRRRAAIRRSPPRLPTLRFARDAWAKLLYLRDRGPTEIGALGISAPGDPLLVAEVLLVRQWCAAARVAFADDAVADLFDALVDEGRRPADFGRVWLHTHPGNSPRPSPTDEATFARVFGRCDWAVMAILARGGASSARLRVGADLGVEVEIPLAVDFAAPFAGSDAAAWEAEYEACFALAIPPRDLFDPPDPWSSFDEWIWSPRNLDIAYVCSAR